MNKIICLVNSDNIYVQDAKDRFIIFFRKPV